MRGPERTICTGCGAEVWSWNGTRCDDCIAKEQRRRRLIVDATNGVDIRFDTRPDYEMAQECVRRAIDPLLNENVELRERLQENLDDGAKAQRKYLQETDRLRDKIIELEIKVKDLHNQLDHKNATHSINFLRDWRREAEQREDFLVRVIQQFQDRLAAAEQIKDSLLDHHTNFGQFLNKFAANQQPCDPEIAQVINDHFWDMYGPINEDNDEVKDDI